MQKLSWLTAFALQAFFAVALIAQPVTRTGGAEAGGGGDNGTLTMVVPSGVTVDAATKIATVTTAVVPLPVANDVIRLRPAGAPVSGLTPEEAAAWIKTHEITITAEGTYFVRDREEPALPLPPERGALHTGEGEDPNAMRATISYSGPWKLDEPTPDTWQTVPQWVEKYEDGRESALLITRIGPVNIGVDEDVRPQRIRLWTMSESGVAFEGAFFMLERAIPRHRLLVGTQVKYNARKVYLLSKIH
jgi:hypothetical protein